VIKGVKGEYSVFAAMVEVVSWCEKRGNGVVPMPKFKSRVESVGLKGLERLDHPREIA
jgi:hypothetical protein